MAKSKKPEQKAPDPRWTASVEGILRKDSDDQNPIHIHSYHKVEINWDRVEGMMAAAGDLKMCAAAAGVHWNTLERRILERYGENFREVRQYYMTDVKALALKQLRNLVAKGNVRATIFMNKAWNNMNDRPKEMGDDDDDQDASVFKLAYDPHEPPPIEAEYKDLNDE